MKKLIYLIVLALILGLVLTGCSLLSNISQVPANEQSGISGIAKNGPPPNGKCCIDFESTGLSEGNSVEGTVADPLINIDLQSKSTSKSLILIKEGTSLTKYTAYNTVPKPGIRNGCLNGDYGFGCPVLDAAGAVNLATALGNEDKIVFTFPLGVTVSYFSIMMFDYGDFYPLGGFPHKVILTGDNGSTAEYFGPGSVSNPGHDACAGEGQQQLEITGTGITKVTLEFVSGTDPGIGFDDICFTIEPVPIDIKPQSCPNPINVKNQGVLPVAILGTEDFDVNDIEPSTILLEGVPPLRWAFEDVATPFEPFINESCSGCTTEGPDGYIDLTLKFDAQMILVQLGLAEQELFDLLEGEIPSDGDCIMLKLTGYLYDGTPIWGEDTVLIIRKGK